MNEHIEIGNCPECGHFPAQIIKQDDGIFARHIHLESNQTDTGKELDCPYSELNWHKQRELELMAQVERLRYWLDGACESLEKTHKDPMWPPAIKSVLNETQPQSLAAIEAEAVNDAKRYAQEKALKDCDSYLIDPADLDEYIEQLRDKAK